MAGWMNGSRSSPLAGFQVSIQLAARIQKLIAEFPTYGYRRLWAILRNRDGVRVNRKAVYRVLVRKRWLVNQRLLTPRPRVQARRSRAEGSDPHWALDADRLAASSPGLLVIGSAISGARLPVLRQM